MRSDDQPSSRVQPLGNTLEHLKLSLLVKIGKGEVATEHQIERPSRRSAT